MGFADPTELLSPCSIWIGSSKDDSTRSHVPGELNEEELAERDGIGIVYMPLVPNKEVTQLHPMDISTWRREMTEEEVQELLNLAQVRKKMRLLLSVSFFFLLLTFLRR